MKTTPVIRSSLFKDKLKGLSFIMRILVCCFLEHDLNMLQGRALKFIDNTKADVSYLRSLWNSYDQSALEIALLLRDQAASMQKNIELHALTIADDSSDLQLKTLLALNYNTVTRIQGVIPSIFNSHCISTIIVNYLKQAQLVDTYDLILCGRQSIESNCGKIPFLIAEQLSYHCIDDAIELSFTAKNNLSVRSEWSNGIANTIIKKPTIITIGDQAFRKLRIPTLKDRMSFGKRSICVTQAFNEKIEPGISDIFPVHMQNIEHKRRCTLIESNESEAILTQLFKEVRTKMLRSSS